MANQMLEDVFRHSHPDLVGMEISPSPTGGEKENETPSNNNNFNNDSSNNSHGSDSENNGSSKPSSFKQGTLPSRKSVEFAVLPSPKRVRHGAEWSLKQAIETVATAVTPDDRLRAIEGALETFTHDAQVTHDEELDSGADAILTKHLAFVLWPLLENAPQHDGRSGHSEGTARELRLTLDALESVYRASSEAVGRSFKRVGRELVKVILTALNKELDRRVEENLVVEDQTSTSKEGESDYTNDEANGSGDYDNDGDDKMQQSSVSKTRNDVPRPMSSSDYSVEGDNIIRHSARILGHFARVGNVTKTLAHFPGLLETLVRLITLCPYDRIPFEARLAAIWTLANLGCNSENMQMMVGTPGLIQGLMKVSCRSVHPGDSVESTVEILRGRSIASRCILNLSWDPENKIVLGRQAALVELLAELAVHRHAPLAKSRTVREILITTRRHAVGALRNLAAAPRRSKIALVEHRNGHVLTVLTDAALNDPDQFVTDRAFAAISNLAIQDTAEQLVKHPALVLALKNVLVSSDEDDTAVHEEGTPRAHASATLMVLERSIRPEMPAYNNLRNLLDALNPSMSDSKLDDYDEHPMKVDQVTAV
ncbi:hypothetical protein ACA910_006059 [Epithemia clementina (nom. ined.)]